MKTKKTFNISHYEAIFNDQNETCGLTINLDEYEIPTSQEEQWQFSVDFKNNHILVESDNYSLLFINADLELLRRVMKTDQLPILYGRSKTNTIDGAIISNPLI